MATQTYNFITTYNNRITMYEANTQPYNNFITIYGDANIQPYNNFITTYNNRITMYEANTQPYNNFITIYGDANIQPYNNFITTYNNFITTYNNFITMYEANTRPANQNPLEGGRGATAPKGRNLHNRRSLTCGKRPAACLCLKGRTDVADERLTTKSRLLYAVLPFRQFYVCVESRRSSTCGYENPAFQAANDAQTRRSFIIYGDARRASLQSQTHRGIGDAISCTDVATCADISRNKHTTHSLWRRTSVRLYMRGYIDAQIIIK